MELYQNISESYFLKSIFEESPDAIFIEDLDGKILMANPAAGILHNCDCVDLIGKTIYEITDPQDHDDMRSRQSAISNGKIHSFQTIMSLPNSGKVPIDVRMQRIGFEDTEAILMMVRINQERLIREEYLRKLNTELETIVVDRTRELQELNLELRREIRLREQAEKEVADQKNFLQTIIDADPNMVTVKDENGVFLFVNKAFAKFYNKEVKELIGLSNWYLNNDEAEIKVLQKLDEQVLSKKLSLEFKEVKIRSRESAQNRNLHVRKSLIKDAEGKNLIFTFISDVTEFTKIQDELERSNAELEKFAYIASHDLQSPLRTISSYLQLIQKKIDVQDQVEVFQFINYSIEGAKKMQQIIQDLLNYSRIQKGHKNSELINMNLLFEDVINIMEHQILSNDVKISIDAMPAIIGFKQPLMQLFQNLIDNAIKFVRNRTPDIKISSKASDEEWMFVVSDNGIGISHEYDQSIFEIFTRLHSESEFPGTGVGLAICVKVVEMHKGKIWFESEMGKGSKFFVTISKSLNGFTN